MNKDEMIVTLTKKVLQLEKDSEHFVQVISNGQEQNEELEGYLKEIQTELDYNGHYGNTVGVIRSLRKKGRLARSNLGEQPR